MEPLQEHLQVEPGGFGFMGISKSGPFCFQVWKIKDISWHSIPIPGQEHMDWDTLNGFICAQENQGIFSSGISLEDTFPELSPSSQEPHPVSFSLVQSISHGSHGCKGFQHLSYDLGARYLGKKASKKKNSPCPSSSPAAIPGWNCPIPEFWQGQRDSYKNPIKTPQEFGVWEIPTTILKVIYGKWRFNNSKELSLWVKSMTYFWQKKNGEKLNWN